MAMIYSNKLIESLLKDCGWVGEFSLLSCCSFLHVHFTSHNAFVIKFYHLVLLIQLFLQFFNFTFKAVFFLLMFCFKSKNSIVSFLCLCLSFSVFRVRTDSFFFSSVNLSIYFFPFWLGRTTNQLQGSYMSSFLKVSISAFKLLFLERVSLSLTISWSNCFWAFFVFTLIFLSSSLLGFTIFILCIFSSCSAIAWLI